MYRSRDGRWTVEHMIGTAAEDGRPRDLLRVSHNGYQVAVCRSVDEVAELVNLADLELVEDHRRPLAPAS
ncbi:hypothetical protein AB0I55_29995 [Actinocatenispora sera]|jgi:hypothetical protein|uniref:Transposase n=1 Tax=Actinocatenispora sera TaxID=390989 RepID=A0A810KWR6_9ACTN|nr:hypothetical protein [Actinocatenispora sera]BCJ26776.1 hypothetical protein Asera_08840 [Actinocatenispora sera]